MGPESIVRRTEGLQSAPIDDEIVFLNPKTDSYVALDAIGRRVWELLAQPRRVADVVEDLAGEFDAPRDEIAADAQHFFDELEREGMVSVVEQPPT